jgi:hypothetical protein
MLGRSLFAGAADAKFGPNAVQTQLNAVSFL